MHAEAGGEARRGPLREIVQPFLDLYRAPRALWGVNLNYLIEGFVYFGSVVYLAMYFNQYVGLDDQRAGWMVGVQTSGITIAMFFFGGRADRWGARRALVTALVVMLAGRILLAAGPALGLTGGALVSPLNLLALGGIVFVVLGYGVYQPAAYSATRAYTTPATANMAYAMLYAVMNLGAWLPTFMSPIRERYGIAGAYWFYCASTAAGIVLLLAILTRRAAADAQAAAAPGAKPALAEQNGAPAAVPEPGDPVPPPPRGPLQRAWHWLRNHPMADAKFSFFIFALIPVQTLFAHNWLTLPMYVERAYRGGWVGDRFEMATNLNALLIFVFAPIAAALTRKGRVYDTMIVGTAIMAAPAFLLAFGPTVWGLFGYIVLMTIGEAIWQPRFLQYAAEIAPEGRTGAYMGVAQFPWFLTKMIVPIYSGWFLARYCPPERAGDTGTMWLIYAVIASLSTVLLIVARPWLGRNFKTTA